MQGLSRDRDEAGRARNARPRDELGRPLPRDAAGGAPPLEEPALPPAAALRRAQELLDEGRPFTAHEVLEAVWKASMPADRGLWRGLAQLAVAVTHQARGNPTGAAALLARAAENLAPYDGTHPHGIAVGQLRQWATDGGAGPMPALVGSGG